MYLMFIIYEKQNLKAKKIKILLFSKMDYFLNIVFRKINFKKEYHFIIFFNKYDKYVLMRYEKCIEIQYNVLT